MLEAINRVYSARRWKVRHLLQRGHFVASLHTALWIAQECWYEWRLGVQTTPASIDYTGVTVNHIYETLGFRSIFRLFREIGTPQDVSTSEVFMDAGCGMGRFLIIAAQYPYAKVLGFDYDPALVEIAQANLKNVGGKVRARDLHVEVGDGGNYDLPDDVTTLLMFSPFQGHIMDAFMESVRKSLLRQPRTFRIIFGNPKFLSLERYPWLKQTHEFRLHAPFFDGAEQQSWRVKWIVIEPNI